MRSSIGDSASDPLFVKAVSGSGTSASTQGTSTNPMIERAIGSDALVTGQNPSSANSGAALQVVPARAGRRSVTITNITGTQVLYVGNAGVTAANGFPLAAVAGASVSLPFTGPVFALSAGAAQTIGFAETF
ncbi:hypothetical protein HNO88_000316 [Novosphingobium chloroacetimidivorans]|uniref:Uncharacterized protein n=1 Tax=Novosphingobium chloroacetimidivorans TaxID=1428314 RepID=A0A7W7K788_9SPHN|nr:hypothetical protein [Novosphingobium chloroacetimidivorans]MBB4857019.1 hypothetical protein [Novosphingobium chloroacetimidivorans]